MTAQKIAPDLSQATEADIEVLRSCLATMANKGAATLGPGTWQSAALIRCINHLEDVLRTSAEAS